MKPKILCSACLGFCHCRYDGSKLNNELVNSLSEYVEFETVCPEMGIGLPSPREAIRVVTQNGARKLVGSYSGDDHTEKMNTFISGFFEKFDVETFDGVILKSKSPTCSFKDVKHYPSHGKVQSFQTKTNGFFGSALKDNITSLLIEEEGRLLDSDIRDHFLTSVFLHYEYRKVKSAKSPYAALVDFHTKNKYLLMAYNQAALKRLGQIVANHDKLEIPMVIAKYEADLQAMNKSSLKPGKNVNMLLHLFGYFKKELSANEKTFFLDQILLYQKQLVSLNSLLLILKSWVIRFEEPYLSEQTIFSHYPMDISKKI